MSNPNTGRRQFIKASAVGLLAIPVIGLFRGVQAAKAAKGAAKAASPLPSGMKAVSETDPVATAIGYKANIKDIDYEKYPQRKKPDAKNQFCNNCALYTASNDSWGKCQMLTSGVVAGEGWCGSWNKKA